MARLRSDLSALDVYVPGRTIEEVANEIGLPPEQIVKLASNESPDGPFPGAVAAVIELLSGSNRYPDDNGTQLRQALAGWLDVAPDQIWLGNGSVGLLEAIALAVGGPGTSAVYAWPSFVMYRLASTWAMTEPVEVPLTRDHVHDLAAMREAIRDDTTAVYLCNPNNPTATIVGSEPMAEFIASVPEQTLVVVDEAYHDYVSNERYATAIPHALERENVVVLRTFSKVFALAGHRIGYGLAASKTIESLRKTQPPFSVTDFGQAAAVASLRDPAELRRRVEANAAARHHVLGALAERSLVHTRSHANFVYFETPHRSEIAAGLLASQGVIVRPMSGNWLRASLGHDDENRRLIAALDEILSIAEPGPV